MKKWLFENRIRDVEGDKRRSKQVLKFSLGGLTRKNALARNVYVKTVQPIHPPVPFPPLRISENTRVTITPTNLYPEYANRSNSWESLLMLRIYVPNFNPRISISTTANAAVAVSPITSV